MCAISIGSNGQEGFRDLNVVDPIGGDERIEPEIQHMSADCQSLVDTEMSTETMRPVLDDSIVPFEIWLILGERFRRHNPIDKILNIRAA